MNIEDICVTIIASLCLLALLGLGIYATILYLKHEYKYDKENKRLWNKALKKYLGIKDESDII